MADLFDGESPDANGDSSQTNAPKSAASLIIELALKRYHVGVTEEGQPYAVKTGRHVVRMLRGGKNSLPAASDIISRKIDGADREVGSPSSCGENLDHLNPISVVCRECEDSS